MKRRTYTVYDIKLSRVAQYRRVDPCALCNGGGLMTAGRHDVTCGRCHGAGYHYEESDAAFAARHRWAQEYAATIRGWAS